MSSIQRAPLQLWAGAECTVVRVGHDYRDQAAETGHDTRIEDIDLFAKMGAKAVRFPILWERIAPDRLTELDFTWSDQRLERLRANGIQVIGGLLHHGSGPRYTDLLDPAFPWKLAEFAARVAERYPWIEHWTPVNEPLTTARFSGLYGHWYPHGRNYPTFLRALANQCRGTLQAMRAIRKVIPHAKLVQTEDLGKTFSTQPLRHQAAHENERRWLSLDLLAGRVTAKHPFHGILADAGIGLAEMEVFESGEATPDLIGINHYLTSERFLDHRLHLYPDHEVGGNGRDVYVDAEAVRVKRLEDDTGFGPRLREAWARYGIPMAITEVHHGCNRPEQLRWFMEVWDTAQRMRDEGVDLRAVTLWSMFGNVDWRFLLTERRGLYDTGAFDVRSGTPRPTVIAKAAAAIGNGESFDHPVLDMPGWWRRPPRLYPWSGKCKPMEDNGRKLLITGATGTLGQAFAHACEERALPFVLTTRAQLDICAPPSVAAAMAEHQPWAVINTAGFVRVADAEAEREACFAWNAGGAGNLAQACAASGVPLVTFSSDLVFDGQLGRPYLEDDPVRPANVYGESKAEAERLVLAAPPDALVVRTAAFFGPRDRHNFAWAVLDALANGRPFKASRTSFVSPTYVPDLCHTTLDLLVDGETGLWHLANQGRMSWYDLAVRVSEEAGFDPAGIKAEDGPPADNSLASKHGAQIRAVDEAIRDYVAAVRDQFQAPALAVAAE
ncbi:MAG TPA: family 1 glycosylhydrolase [Allosphingosinicella sp.]|nr:family 1 glycosylhydrolase [Allosphingosinicella sp.]